MPVEAMPSLVSLVARGSLSQVKQQSWASSSKLRDGLQSPICNFVIKIRLLWLRDENGGAAIHVDARTQRSAMMFYYGNNPPRRVCDLVH